MNTFQWPLRALFFVCLLQSISCTKSIDKVPNDSVSLETSSDATVANEFANCKLRRIVHENPFVSESTVNMLFSYNAAGNPYSVIHTGPLVIPSSGYPTQNYYFYYDKKNRFRKLLINFTENGLDEYTEEHRYGYDTADVIIVDTTFAWWEATPGPTVKRITKLTYDNQGRIIKENIQDFYWGTTRNPTYTYDARGNLAVPGWKSSGYDNKVSIFRAHPLFQFIHRNYSRNNALAEAAYNSRGLPLAVRQLNDDFFGAYRINPNNPPNPLGGIIRAVYDCQ
jgi:hypothetical protein